MDDNEVKEKSLWALNASIEEIDKELQQINLTEEKCIQELSNQLTQKKYIDDKIRGLNKIVPTLQVVKQEAGTLVQIIKNISESSKKISGEIKSLDLARSRIEESHRRVSDLIDLEYCAKGVQMAINNEEYEIGAGHIHRFLTIDQTLLKRTAADVKKAPGILRSVHTLQDAAQQLRAIVKHRFTEAIRKDDLAVIDRFFKIFPLIGMHEEGIHEFCLFLSNKLQDTAQKNLNIALNTSIADERFNVIYADTLTLLFEGVARIIDSQHPSIESYYGHGWLLSAVKILQAECDRQCQRIINELNRNRQISKRFAMINESNTSGSSTKLERVDPKDLDVLIGELTIMHARTELYLKYIRRKVNTDLELGIPDVNLRTEKLDQLEHMITNSQLSQSKHEILGYYLRLEQYFMEESISKAVLMDAMDTSSEVKTSSVVDDTFFIIRKCIRRALSTGSLDGCCAIINNGCRVLESDYCSVLKTRLKQGYPYGYLDLSQAYNVLQTTIQQGRLQPNDAEQQRTIFIVALNNADISAEYVETLSDNIMAEIELVMPGMKENERGKLECCLSGLSAVIVNLKAVADYGMQQLKSSAIKPRITTWIDAFSAINHHFTEDELGAYEAGGSFVESLIFNLDSLLASFRDSLTPNNYDVFVAMVTAEVTARLEISIMKSSFNRLGGLIMDKEIRSLSGYLTTSTSWSVRDKFARLTQIATILNFEKVTEIADYWGSHEGALTWRLTPSEVRTVMSLRVDFKIEDIRKLKL